MSKLILLFTVTSLITLTASPAPAQSPPDSDAVHIPEAVRTFITIATSSNESLKLKTERGSTFDPAWSLLYFFKVQIPSDSPAGAPAWLIGYRLGRDGHEWINRAVAVDTYGKPLFTFPDQLAGDDAVAVELRPHQWFIAVTHENRFANEAVELWTLMPPHRKLFRYEGPSDFIWESTLYFIDHNNAVTKSILVTRTVRAHDGNKLRLEHVIYDYDDKSSSYSQPHPLPTREFARLLRQARTRGPVPQINQYGPPYEIPPDER